MKYPIGTTFTMRHGKITRVHTVVDFYTTTNMAGEIVLQRYVAAHDFLGQQLITVNITETAISRGLIK